LAVTACRVSNELTSPIYDINVNFMENAGSLLSEQLDYYRAIAKEYGDHSIDVPGKDELVNAIMDFKPTGDVLELACGSGKWTPILLKTAETLTAVDGAPEMLSLVKAHLPNTVPTRFIEADLFSWVPDKQYDAIFFGFWISHVPEERFEPFWSMVATALKPGGRVFFCDDNYRPDVELIEGPDSAVVERRLNDGSPYRIIKVPHQAESLEARLRSLGWDIAVTSTSGPMYWGVGGR